MSLPVCNLSRVDSFCIPRANAFIPGQYHRSLQRPHPLELDLNPALLSPGSATYQLTVQEIPWEGLGYRATSKVLQLYVALL